jgi:AcrR family transcriptional regulator
MAKRANADKRPRRPRGSINPDDILTGAFELAEQVGLDNLSMPLLGRHLGVGVTSIYWYFRKKDDLLNAMTSRALRQYSFGTPYGDATTWRESLHSHAHDMRKTFLSNPILTDLVLIRGALSPNARRLGTELMENTIEGLVEAGLSPDDAFDTYSAVSLHVRGSVVLNRLNEKTREPVDEAHGLYESWAIDPQASPLIAQMNAAGHRMGVADDHNFEYGLTCILDHASSLMKTGSGRADAAKKASSPRRRASPKAVAKKAGAKKAGPSRRQAPA